MDKKIDDFWVMLNLERRNCTFFCLANPDPELAAGGPAPAPAQSGSVTGNTRGRGRGGGSNYKKR